MPLFEQILDILPKRKEFFEDCRTQISDDDYNKIIDSLNNTINENLESTIVANDVANNFLESNTDLSIALIDACNEMLQLPDCIRIKGDDEEKVRIAADWFFTLIFTKVIINRSENWVISRKDGKTFYNVIHS